MATTSYAIGLGSNRRGRNGAPADEIAAALQAIGGVVTASAIVASDPIGPSTRRFANAVALIESEETPPRLLARLKAIERAFGRRRGRRWGQRVLDIDILLWSGGAWSTRTLTIPHVGLARRAFVLKPLLSIAPDRALPMEARAIRRLAVMVDRRRPRS